MRGSANVFDQIGSSKCGKFHKTNTICSYIRLKNLVGGGVKTWEDQWINQSKRLVCVLFHQQNRRT